MRFSDFGGASFEQTEANPMIGLRGASPYHDERYRDGFPLECAAVRRVRQVIALTNVRVMIPFCRTLGEARAVLEAMRRTDSRVQGWSWTPGGRSLRTDAHGVHGSWSDTDGHEASTVEHREALPASARRGHDWGVLTPCASDEATRTGIRAGAAVLDAGRLEEP